MHKEEALLKKTATIRVENIYASKDEKALAQALNSRLALIAAQMARSVQLSADK